MDVAEKILKNLLIRVKKANPAHKKPQILSLEFLKKCI